MDVNTCLHNNDSFRMNVEYCQTSLNNLCAKLPIHVLICCIKVEHTNLSKTIKFFFQLIYFGHINFN